MENKSYLKHCVIGAAAFVLVVLAFFSLGTIPAGYVGVKTRFGAATGKTFSPGLVVVVPFVENVSVMDVQVQKDQTDATAASNDLQQVTATVAVNYHVEPNDAVSIYQNVGIGYADRVISPAIQESVKSITANYTAEQLITKRETVREDIKDLLTQKLQAYGIQTDSLNIVNFAFSDQFNQAVESKVTAQQNALAAQNKLQQVQFEAQQTVATAKANAEAIQIQAQAIEQQGGANYVKLQAINKWNGQLPTNMYGGAVPFVSVSQ